MDYDNDYVLFWSKQRDDVSGFLACLFYVCLDPSFIVKCSVFWLFFFPKLSWTPGTSSIWTLFLVYMSVYLHIYTCSFFSLEYLEKVKWLLCSLLAFVLFLFFFIFY